MGFIPRRLSAREWQSPARQLRQASRRPLRRPPTIVTGCRGVFVRPAPIRGCSAAANSGLMLAPSGIGRRPGRFVRGPAAPSPNCCRRRHIGIEFHGLLQVLEGRVGPPAAQQGRAETILCFGIAGLDGHGVLEVVEALLGFAALDQNPSQVAVRHPLERVEFQGRAVTADRVFGHPQILISHAEIGLGPRILRTFLHGVAPNREHAR